MHVEYRRQRPRPRPCLRPAGQGRSLAPHRKIYVENGPLAGERSAAHRRLALREFSDGVLPVQFIIIIRRNFNVIRCSFFFVTSFIAECDYDYDWKRGYSSEIKLLLR